MYKRQVLLLIEHTKRGDFIPVAWELPFGSKDPDSLPAFKISLPDGRTLELSGRIDRVDMAYDPDSGKSYFRIIDYKSGQLSPVSYTHLDVYKRQGLSWLGSYL